MPIITKLSSQKRADYVNLYVDDEFYCGLSLNQVAAHRLHKGQELTESELDGLRQEANESKAYAAALRYLGLRIRSKQEIRDYLKRKELDANIHAVIDRLERENYLNDEDFAIRWQQMRLEQSRSPQAIRAELIKKGISKDILDTVAIEKDDPHVLDAIIHLAEKKQRYRTVEKQKLIAYLGGRGFRYNDIRLAAETRPDLFSQ